MEDAFHLTQSQLPDFLLHVAVVRPVFIWGAPGIGKSALVGQFASALGLDCVSLLGSQLAPEDLMGVPKIEGGKSIFCPPENVARDEAYCLFLDELNACSHEVQKSFYSLIHDHRIGNYELPEGSIVIGAGNRAQDSAIVKPISSALINRMVHVHLSVSHRDWLAWAEQNGIHHLVLQYIGQRPDHLWKQPPKHEAPFSSPRAWHMVSDVLKSYGDENLTLDAVEAVAFGCLTKAHAIQFRTFYKSLTSRYKLASIIKGDEQWPGKPEDTDLLYFLAQSFRAQLIKELPPKKGDISGYAKDLAFNAKGLIRDLCAISFEHGQMVVAEDEDGESLPDWFLLEIARDLPRLTTRHPASR